MLSAACLCLVTDRRRLVSAAGAALPEWGALLRRQVMGAVLAGVEFVHVRERDLDARALVTLVSALADLARGSGTRLLVNDRLDIALVAGAAGVHLRADSPPPAVIRRLAGRDRVLGCSVHDVADLARARGADFLVAGTVFPSVSKDPRRALLGLQGLRDIVRAAHGVPVLAIGGMSEDVAGRTARTGAAGMASIGAFLPDRGQDPAESVQRRAVSLRSAFDSVDPVP
jgi:thiamine-phosphate pyrophosphorylase